MKKTIALLLAMVMAFSLCACGSKTESAPAAAGSAPAAAPEAAPAAEAKPVKIGVEIYDPTDAEVIQMQTYFALLASQGLNAEFIYSEALASAEDEFAFIDSCYNAGCKGIIGFYNAAKGETVQKCADYGMYYFGAALDDADAFAAFESNPYALDSITYGTGDFDSGYALGEYFGKQGIKKVIYSSGGAAFGVEMFVQRKAGFDKACEEFGIEYVDIPGFPDEAFFASIGSALADPDVKGVAASFSGLGVWAQPILNAGRKDDVPLATIDSVSDEFVTAFEDGSIGFLSSSNVSRLAIGVALIMNAVDGNAEALQKDGKIGVYQTCKVSIDNAETAKAAAAAVKQVYSVADLESLIVSKNPDANAQTLADLIEIGNSIDAMIAHRAEAGIA